MERRFLVSILYYLSEIDSLRLFIEELNKDRKMIRRLGYRERVEYKSTWNFRNSIPIDIFNRLMISVVKQLQLKGIISKCDRWNNLLMQIPRKKQTKMQDGATIAKVLHLGIMFLD